MATWREAVVQEVMEGVAGREKVALTEAVGVLVGEGEAAGGVAEGGEEEESVPEGEVVPPKRLPVEVEQTEAVKVCTAVPLGRGGEAEPLPPLGEGVSRLLWDAFPGEGEAEEQAEEVLETVGVRVPEGVGYSVEELERLRLVLGV